MSPREATSQLGLFEQKARAAVDPMAGLGHVVRGTLALVEVAEQEIAAAGLTKKQSLAVFTVLCPPSTLVGKEPGLYRHHAREILARFVSGLDLDLATDAELLTIALFTAGVAPLSSTGQPVAEFLFERVFPEKAAEVLTERAREKWSGQVAEEVAQLRKKYRRDRGFRRAA